MVEVECPCEACLVGHQLFEVEVEVVVVVVVEEEQADLVETKRFSCLTFEVLVLDHLDAGGTWWNCCCFQ